jgi:hypothetical protein
MKSATSAREIAGKMDLVLMLSSLRYAPVRRPFVNLGGRTKPHNRVAGQIKFNLLDSFVSWRNSGVQMLQPIHRDQARS